MSHVINTAKSISMLALAVYDEKGEVLKEATPEDLVFTVKANQKNMKRLYLIGELLYTHNITITANIDSEEYDVKVLSGIEFTRYSDFADKTNTVVVTYSEAPHKFLNALAVDVLLESKAFSLTSVPITITIEVND